MLVIVSREPVVSDVAVALVSAAAGAVVTEAGLSDSGADSDCTVGEVARFTGVVLVNSEMGTLGMPGTVEISVEAEVSLSVAVVVASSGPGSEKAVRFVDSVSGKVTGGLR